MYLWSGRRGASVLGGDRLLRVLTAEGALNDRDLQGELRDSRVLDLEVDLTHQPREVSQLAQLEPLRQPLAGLVQVGRPTGTLQEK